MFGSLSTKIAHSTITPALGNQDLRLLQESINKEKELVTSTQKFSRDIGNSADALKQWAAGEGEDLSDVASGSLLLTTHLVSALNTFADHETVIRSQLKEIRTKEEQLDELRRRRKAVGSKLETQEKRLSKMGSENKGLSQATEQLSSLQTELRQLDTSILVDMARMSDYKRNAMRSSLTLKFGGLVELGEKLTIIGELGKLIAAEVPQDVTPPGQGRAPYQGRETVSNLVSEAARCVQEVTFNANPDREFSARPAPSRFHGAGSSVYDGETGRPPEGMRRPPAGGDPDIGPGGSRFLEQSNSSINSQPSFTSPNMSGGGTMPPIRDYGGGAGSAPVDEFGRPIGGLPLSSNTMPAMGSGGTAPIQQMPLSAIQQSMRAPTSPGGPDTYVPSHPGGGGSLSSLSNFHQPGPPPQAGRSQFNGPPQPPSLNAPQPPQQDPRTLRNPAPAQNATQSQDPSGSRFNQQYPQGRQGAMVERGLTLSLPLRQSSQGGGPSRKPVPNEKEMDSPFVPPNAGTAAPSAFKPPAPQMTRQDTTDSDIVLGAGEVDLQRTTTLPPKIGLGGDFPEWSLGLEELVLGGSPVKEAETEGPGNTPAAAAAATGEERKDLPEPPPVEAKSTLDRSPISAVPRSLREEESTSQTASPITQTPTTYFNTQTPTTYTSTATNPDGLTILHDHVVDNPNTRMPGNSGRFAMFPDKRKGTVVPSPERGDSLVTDTLIPPHAKFSSHPGVDRTPSPYPTGVSPGVSPVPTPGSEKQGGILSINAGHPDDGDGFPSPVTAGTDGPPRSILLSPAESRAGTMAATDSNATPGRLRFAPRPPSPITPSPVTPGNPAWASVDSVDRGGDAGPKAALTSVSTSFNKEASDGHAQQGPTGGPQKSDNRLSVITPLEIHKNKEGGSHPATPNQGTSTLPQGELTDEQFNAMLDSFSAQVSSTGSNPPSGVESTNSSKFSTGPNDISYPVPDNSLGNSQGPSHELILSSSGGPDSSRGGSSSAQDSSLDTTAAFAGSPFSSPTPTSEVPSRGYRLADIPRRANYGELDGNVAGVGSSAFSGARSEGLGHRRIGSGGSDTYSDSSSRVISAGAFRRAGGRMSPASRSSPAMSPSASPRQSYQHGQTGPPSESITTPRQDYKPVSPATSQHSGYGGGPGPNYQALQSTPNPAPGDMNSLPPGAASPRYSGQPGQSSYQQRDLRTMGGIPDIYAQGQPSPTQVPSSSTRIPTSLLPGRPGSAAPLAPIGHTQPPPTAAYMSGSGSGPPGAYASPVRGYAQAVPPWQQQQQQHPVAQQGYQLHSPAPTEFEGSVAHHDAYGGIEDDTGYSTGQGSSQGGGQGGQWGGAPRYGQGSWNGR